MMKKHPELDVVDIATPTGYHAEHVIAISNHGKHIVVEKPMALQVADCEAMIKACQKNQCRLFVVKQNRFNHAVQAARKALEERTIRKDGHGHGPSPMVARPEVLRTRRLARHVGVGRGVMSQQASHHLDLLQWFMGPIESMQCQTATRLMDIEVEDSAVAIMKFKSGALGAFEATVATRPKDMEGSLSLLGEKGSVMIGGHAVNKILHWQFIDQRPEDAEMLEAHSQEIPNVYGHGHLPYLADVIQAILQNKPGLVEASEGKKNIEILTALYESACGDGQTVRPGCPVKLSKLGVR